MSIVAFLSQSGPRAEKHTQSWLHPICTFLLHYLIITTSIFLVHDLTISTTKRTYIQNSFSTTATTSKHQIAKFSFWYFVALMSYRLILNRNNPIIQKGISYEGTWLCNSTMFMGALGLWTDRDIVVLAQVVAVSIDQVLWYVDLTGYMVSGFRKFPIGVAKYLTWPDTTWADRITCTHHLWTIPLFIYACKGFEYPWETYLLSFFIIILNVSLSRWMTPFILERKLMKYRNRWDMEKYLNVNLSHELWKDITIESLQIQRDNPPAYLYLFRLLWRWQAFNGFVFVLVLYPLSLFFYPYGIAGVM